jgi:hypothetical protein
MKRVFTASSVVVLNFSHNPDSSHTIIPPEAHAEFPKKIDVLVGEGDYRAGYAMLRRQDNQILADMTLVSHMEDDQEALRLMKTLYPALELTVLEAYKNTILKLTLDGLFLTYHRNDDLNILPLGEAIRPKGSTQRLH